MAIKNPAYLTSHSIEKGETGIRKRLVSNHGNMNLISICENRYGHSYLPRWWVDGVDPFQGISSNHQSWRWSGQIAKLEWGLPTTTGTTTRRTLSIAIAITHIICSSSPNIKPSKPIQSIHPGNVLNLFHTWWPAKQAERKWVSESEREKANSALSNNSILRSNMLVIPDQLGKQE